MIEQANESGEQRLPLFASVGMPLGSIVLLFLAPFLPEDIYYSHFLSETGFIEIATVLFLLVAIGVLITLLRRWKDHSVMLRAWILALLLGSVFFAGEEIDWGQVWMDISTPERLEDVNREGQFNLHKIDSHWLPRILFNNGPRLAATLAMLLGAAVAVRRRDLIKRFPKTWHGKARLMMPEKCTMFIFLVAAFSTVPAKIIKSLYRQAPGVPEYLELALRKPSGEFKEYAIAMAIMLYVWALAKRCSSTGRGES